ncbi:MAG TPA: WYL domain-containing protein [Myxococcaceae bacterium]
MDRAERLLDLLALLLDATEPMSWAELRDAFPEDYGSASDEAAERKFERDKAELLELGIPITYVQGDDERKDGYVIDRDAYYLADAGLTKEELAVLYAAGSAALASEAFPGRQDLAHALRKVGFFGGEHLPHPRVRVELGEGAAASPQVATSLEQLWAAIAARKFVQIQYFSPRAQTVTDRRVDPYGLAMRRGVWSLVGYCHLRQGIRTFFVHRIRSLSTNPAKPRSADFDVPAGFVLDDYVANQPWEFRIHPPVPVTLELCGALAKMAAGMFPGGKVSRADGGARVEVQVTSLEELLRYALSLGKDCKVMAPERAVADYRKMAQRVLDAHAEAPA